MDRVCAVFGERVSKTGELRDDRYGMDRAGGERVGERKITHQRCVNSRTVNRPSASQLGQKCSFTGWHDLC